jgi:predicted permease
VDECKPLVLGATYGDRIAGYIALYLIGWSPALWTVGYLLLTGGGGGGDGAAAAASSAGKSFKAKLANFGQVAAMIVKETANPPVIGICLGVLVGVTPLRHVLIGGGGSAAAAAAAAVLPPVLAFPGAVAKVRRCKLNRCNPR